MVAALLLSVSARADNDHDMIKRLRDAGEILPLETIIARFRVKHPEGRVLEAELEEENGRYVYEIYMLYESGIVLELEFDAHTGEFWRIEEDH